MEDKRRFRRIPFKEPVQFRIKEQAESAGCIAFDLSERGIRLTNQDFIPIRKEVTLTLQMDSGLQFDVQGQVVWIQRVPHSEYYQLGLEFSSQQADQKVFEELQEYLQAH
jgi:hypothetical protein